MSTMKTCAKRYEFAYEIGLRPDRDAQPLRMGSAVHLGLDLRAQGKTLAEVVQAIMDNYADRPAWADPFEWEVEAQTVVRLLCGYDWYWGDSDYEVVATEQTFDLPLVNPDTGHASRTWRLGGKSDKIVRLRDIDGGGLALMEHKTCREDISPDADYWKRLRIDQQISLYMLAAREMGYDVGTIIYDVIRKPSIAPKKPVKRDLDGDTYFGELVPTIDTDRETPAMFGARLLADIGERPEFYFARREIPRLESDLEEFKFDCWQQSKLIRECQKALRWPKNTNACLMPYRCPYLEPCSNNINPREFVPAGFVRVENVHPELGDHAHETAPETAAADHADCRTD
jgi:hypothetical protein